MTRAWSNLRYDGPLVTQGSLKCIGGRGSRGGGHMLIDEHADEIDAFRQHVELLFNLARGAGRASSVDGEPVEVSYSFRLVRPRSVKRPYPTRKGSGATGGDIDKLMRAVNDALTGLAWDDDSQIVRVGATEKLYASDVAPPGFSVSWRVL